MRPLTPALAATLLLLLGELCPAQTATERDWVLVYWMSYDNNLDGCARPILDMLRAGIETDRLAVVVVADRRDREGMRRHELTRAGEVETRLADEDSADERTLARELEWVGQRYPARRYAVVFLDHGGRLGEMCHDERPGPSGRDWLYPPAVARVLERWRSGLRAAQRELERVFLQQCGRGSLENLHAFRAAAPLVMASQTVVGAPNRYYAPALQRLGRTPQGDGLALARAITECETPDMFTTYTTVRGARLAELSGRLDALLRPVLAGGPAGGPAGDEVRAGLAPCFDAGSERFYDALPWLAALYAARGLDPAPVRAFGEWVARELVAVHRVSPRAGPQAKAWSGVALFSPASGRELGRYREDYPLYRESLLDELHLELAGEPEPADAQVEALVRRAQGAGCDAGVARELRLVLAEHRRVRAVTQEAARAGRIDPDEVRARQAECTVRLQARLGELLRPAELSALELPLASAR